MSADASSVVQALASNADIFLWLIQVVAALIGLWFVIEALMRLVQASKGGRGFGQSWGIGSPIGGVAIGAFLINFAFTVSTTVESFWGDSVSYNNIISYSQQMDFGMGEWKLVLRALAAMVAVFGAYAILEGFLFWKKCADGRSGEDFFRKGLTHIFGGSAAVNIMGTINLLTSTANVNLKSFF